MLQKLKYFLVCNKIFFTYSQWDVVLQELQETLQKLVTADRKYGELGLELDKRESLHSQLQVILDANWSTAAQY